MLGTLQDCPEWPETVVFHDWVCPSCLFRPHSVDEPEEVPGRGCWRSVPNGAAFGILGHAWERSLCVFGVGAITHVAVEHQFTNRGADRVIMIDMLER